MRVLHVIPAVAPRYGGPSHAIVQMCAALRDRGTECLVVTTDADGRSRLPVQLERPVTYRGMPTLFFRRQWSESFKYSRPLARWLDTGVTRFDVVHIHAVFSHACLEAGRACRQRAVPYVVRPLGTLDPWSLGQKPVRKRILWHWRAREVLRRAAAIQYTTAEERRRVERSLGLERGVVIPLGVDDELLIGRVEPGRFRGRYPELAGRPYALVLGRLHPKKGLELLLEAFLEITRSHELAHWRLVMAGDGDTAYVARLRRLIERRDGANRVLCVGWLDGVEKAAALGEAALLVLSSRQENLGLAALEALACGVPVLVSAAVNLAPEIQSAGAGWVTGLQHGALTTTLIAALQSEQERARRGAAGRELVTHRFRWSSIAAELDALYRAVSARALVA